LLQQFGEYCHIDVQMRKYVKINNLESGK